MTKLNRIPSQLEKATKKRGRGARPSVTKVEPWLQRTLEYFTQLNVPIPAAGPPSSMALRDRTKPSSSAEPGPAATKATKKKSPKQEKGTAVLSSTVVVSDTEPSAEESDAAPAHATEKKLPKVILKLGPAPKVKAAKDDAAA